MPIYAKDSLDTLKQRIDLVQVISSFVELKAAGAAYKGLCPFHDEKTPSFMIQKGDTHYHCFGCSAHGDAIQFLMAYQKFSFKEAVEYLAEKFHVPLETIDDKDEYKGPSKKVLKEALAQASRFFHFFLLHTPEGREAVDYLFQREISLDFIRRFQVGLAPKSSGITRKYLQAQGVSDEVMELCGIIARKRSGGYRDFFSDRVTFPIHHLAGGVIGFSARKYKEETFGGKYVNTSETPLFKKSRVLFGLNYCRRRIAKERRAVIVEGQIDALRMIEAGFDFTVAAQGTAFGQGHAQELLNLGVNHIYLALDSDAAGQEAAAKIGNFFQKEGVEVSVVMLPPGSDPDTYLREEGSDKFQDLLEQGESYIHFLVDFHSKAINVETPAGKNELVHVLSKQIRGWKHTLMVHESLKRVANLLQVPEHILDVGQEYMPNLLVRKSASIGLQTVNPIRILETDFLRWLLLKGAEEPRLIDIADLNIQPHHLLDPICRRLYQTYQRRVHNELSTDILSLIDDEKDQQLINEIMDKKIHAAKAEECFIETVQKIIDRSWMEKSEEIKQKIHSGKCSDTEVMKLLQEFDAIKKQQPKVVLPTQLK